MSNSLNAIHIIFGIFYPIFLGMFFGIGGKLIVGYNLAPKKKNAYKVHKEILRFHGLVGIISLILLQISVHLFLIFEVQWAFLTLFFLLIFFIIAIIKLFSDDFQNKFLVALVLENGAIDNKYYNRIFL